MSEPLLPLSELRRQARVYYCEVVTLEFLDDVKRSNFRVGELESKLHKVAALRLVAERKDWRGKLTRRWIRRTEAALFHLVDSREEVHT